MLVEFESGDQQFSLSLPASRDDSDDFSQDKKTSQASSHSESYSTIPYAWKQWESQGSLTISRDNTTKKYRVKNKGTQKNKRWQIYVNRKF